MAMREDSVHVRLTTTEAKRLSNALLFALSFLQEFALEQNRGQVEIIMAFMGRLEVAIEAAETLAFEERRDG